MLSNKVTVKAGYEKSYSLHITAMKKHDIRIKYKLSKNMLARWIEPHLEKFETLGYKKRDRTLTPARVALFEVFLDYRKK